MGLTSYYRKFVKGYNLLAKTPTQLLQKNKYFVWTTQAHQAFSQLKSAMASTPVLALPDFHKQFVIEIDACATGVGALLSQEGHPIAYYNKALGVQIQKLSIYEKGFLAIIVVIDRWRSYLPRGLFIIKTDHRSLCYLADPSLVFELQKKAMTKVIGLQYQFQYKKGVDNQVVDAIDFNSYYNN